MQLPEEAPSLKPWPFLVGDAALLATACWISSQSHGPLNGLPLMMATGCIALGAILAIIPYLINHTRRQELELMERQHEIAALAQTTATSAEQISIAAASLHTLAENATRTLKMGEQLPHKLQEKINEFKAQLNEVTVTENEALAQEINTLRTSETERLETALAGVRKTTTDLAAIEAATRQHLAELNEMLARFTLSTSKAIEETTKTIEAAQTTATGIIKNRVSVALAEIDRKLATPSTPDSIRTTPPPFAIAAKPHLAPPSTATPFKAEPHATVLSSSPIAEPSSTTTPPDEKPPRKRLPRKPAADDNELMLDIELPTNEFSQVPPEDAAPAISADGLTRLLVTAYIGIGNKLYIRGDGPGLSWERGTPLQFVSIGKWRWETPEATVPVTLKIYKNDVLECTTPGPLALQPGHQHEVTANFH